MGDEVQSLDLLIKTRADLAGAKAAQAALERQIAQNKYLGQDYSAQEAQLKKVSSSLEEYSQRTGESTAKVEESEISHRGLHHIMGLIGKESAPELGHALGGLLYGPEVGAVLAIGFAFEFMHKQIDAAAEKTKMLREEQSALNTAVWSAERDALNEANTSLTNYITKINQAGTAKDTLKEKDEQELAVLKAIQQADAEILKAREAAELAAAGNDKVKQEEIKARYGAKASADKLADEGDTIVTEQGQLFERESAARKLKKQSDADQSAYMAAKDNPQVALDSEKLKQLIANQAGLDTEAGKTNLPALRERLKTATTGAVPGGVSEATQIQMQINQGEKDAQAAADNKAKVADLNATVEDEKDAIELAKGAAEKSLAAFLENAEAIRALTAKINEATAIFDIHSGTAQAVESIEAPGTPAGKALLNEKGDASKVLTGRVDQVSAESQKLIQELGAMIAGHTVTLQQAAALVVQSDANNTNFLAAIARMNETGEYMRTFSISSAALFEKINKDIDTAFSRIQGVYNSH